MINTIPRQLTFNWPNNLSYDKSDTEIVNFYSAIKGTITEKHSIFYDKRQIDIFLLAMAIGKGLDSSRPLKSPSKTIRRDALTEKEVWLMCSVALSEDNADLDMLADQSKIVQICEEYSNAGIKILIKLNDKLVNSTFQQYEEFLEDAIKNIADEIT